MVAVSIATTSAAAEKRVKSLFSKAVLTLISFLLKPAAAPSGRSMQG
jgi:hypothetical protein